MRETNLNRFRQRGEADRQEHSFPEATSTLIMPPLHLCLPTVNAMTALIAKYCETHKTKVLNEECKRSRLEKEIRGLSRASS